MIEFIESSLHVKDSILWLDAVKAKKLSFISSFNENYIKHSRVIATRETASLLKEFSLSKIPLNILQMPTYKKFSIGDINISLYPSGSNLGSSQILVKRKNKKLLYSGIININNMKIWDEVYYPITDILIFKTNYGEKRYKFPKIDTEIKKLKEYLIENYKNGVNSVIFIDSFGFSQFILKELSELDIPIYLQNRIFDYSTYFKKLDIELGKLRKFSKSILKTSIILYPLSKMDKFPQMDKKCKRVGISGDAVDKDFKENYKFDKTFIISNEADYYDSIKYIETVSPKKLYILPGRNKDIIEYFKDKIELEVFNYVVDKSLF